MLPLHHDPVLGRVYAFGSTCVGHRSAPVVRCSSGSPESRTQRDLVISQVWATGPRLPRSSTQVGMVGLEPTISCSQNTWACRCPTSRFPIATFCFEHPVGESNPCLRIESPPSWATRRTGHVVRVRRAQVGRGALESPSAALQTAAIPSQLPAQRKKPGVASDTGLLLIVPRALAKCHKRKGCPVSVFAT